MLRIEVEFKDGKHDIFDDRDSGPYVYEYDNHVFIVKKLDESWKCFYNIDVLHSVVIKEI